MTLRSACRSKGIEAGIKIADDARTRSRGGTSARPHGRQGKRMTLWPGGMGRTIRVLAALDDRVRVLGRETRRSADEVRSRRRDLMFAEVENKFWTWNEMRREELFN